MASLKIAALIVAGGRGTRCSSDIPKQYQKIKETPLLSYTLKAFLTDKRFGMVLCAIHPEDLTLYKEAISPYNVPYVYGGATRQESVMNGLNGLISYAPDLIFIHDAARPNTQSSDFDLLLKVFEDSTIDGALLALPITDTVKFVENGIIQKTIPRENLFRAQTPQAFRFQKILEAHQKAPHHNFTDDASIAESFGLKVKIVIGSDQNIKITERQDFLKVVVN